jgi:hypothetical protein
MLRPVGLLTVLFGSALAFHPAVAETPAAACLAANGQRLYNIQLYRNTALPPGCKAGDSLVRFQLEQPGTTVRKLRGTLTAPGQKVLGTLGGIEITQIFESGSLPDRCRIEVDVPGNAFRLGGVPGDPPNDIAVDGATFIVGLNHIDADVEFPGSANGGPPDDSQFFLSDGAGLFFEDVVAITDFGPVSPHGCFVAATVRYAADVRSMYGP